MIGAADRSIDDQTFRQSGTAVDAQILPHLRLAGVPPDDKFLAEEPRARDLAVGYIARKADNMPVVDEWCVRSARFDR